MNIWSDCMCQELELDDEGTRISLTIVDTPGFGDLIDNEARYTPSSSGHSIYLC